MYAEDQRNAGYVQRHRAVATLPCTIACCTLSLATFLMALKRAVEEKGVPLGLGDGGNAKVLRDAGLLASPWLLVGCRAGLTSSYGMHIVGQPAGRQHMTARAFSSTARATRPKGLLFG